jgi:hypothetical protein
MHNCKGKKERKTLAHGWVVAWCEEMKMRVEKSIEKMNIMKNCDAFSQ